MVPTPAANSRKRTSTPGAKARENTRNQDTKRGIDLKTPTSTTARASAALAPPPSRWSKVKKSFMPKSCVRMLVFAMMTAGLAAFLVIKEPSVPSLSTGLDDLNHLHDVTKIWLNDFAEKLPNRTSELTARLSKMTSEASYENVLSAAKEALSKTSALATKAVSKVSSVTAETFPQFYDFASEVVVQLSGAKLSESPWHIAGLTLALIIFILCMRWVLKKLFSSGKRVE